MVRAAIIGLGRWGRSLVRAVQGNTDEIHFVAAHARSHADHNSFCTENGLRFFESYDEILADRNIDAVVIATPHSLHVDQVERAAQAGKQIFVEKPLALNRRDADAAVKAAEKADVLLAVGFVRRFHPSIAELRKRLRDGRIGKIAGIVGHQTSGTGRFLPADGWRLDPKESPAAAMTAIGVHIVDLMIEFAGRVHSVHCHTTRVEIPHADDTTSVLLNFKSGASGLLFCSISTGPNFQFSVYGSNGLAEVSESTLETFRFVPVPDHAPTGPVRAPAPEIIRTPGFDMIREELVEFARCIKEKRPYPVSLGEVLHGISVFSAIVESAERGGPILVQDEILGAG